MARLPQSTVDPRALADTLDALREGLQILSFDWRYLYVNEAVARHGRKPPAELLGRTMFEAYPGIEQTPLFEALDTCMRERRPREMETEFVFEDGSRAWFELRIQPCPEGLAVLSLDVTPRKHLQAAAMRAEKMQALGQMAAGVAHDLRNIRNPLVLDLELLRRRLPPDSRADDVVARMAAVLARGNQTIDLLRDLGRHAPEGETRVGEADLGAIAHEAVTLCRSGPVAGRRTVTVDESLIEGPLCVQVSAPELLAAVVNLIVNAVDAVADGGHITLRTGCSDELGWIEVEDDGVGMPPEVEARAFEPFFTTKGERGTGLGLAMVYATTARSGGSARLRTAVGQGTTVTLSFKRVSP